ncbi:hypothetical protein [Aurantimonas sp. VKM B-3413]|uniref:hypothetical protein n=1 Tax=Aurantimonas sp. VKM B-3413 TaxID=2779401 RepID=UPI001E2990A6|nr:hypothetical protein [Aurantimonas sp. VKM B-3413]MCB8838386.1 hypothetical protein [Aurantimonas sp. VKM B-3413]
MLVDMMSGKAITEVPFGKEYRKWMARLTPAEVAAIKAELNAKIDGTEIQTAGWMPGSDWRPTPFQAIYEKAARQNSDIAARCFGLMVWEIFMERPEKWTSGRFENNGEPIGSRTYFQVP